MVVGLKPLDTYLTVNFYFCGPRGGHPALPQGHGAGEEADGDPDDLGPGTGLTLLLLH